MTPTTPQSADPHPDAATPGRRFTSADLALLRVPDDIKVRLVEDVPPVPDGARAPRSELPSWWDRGPDEGAAIALWQMLAPPPGLDVKLPSWLRKQGISYFRGWIRPGGSDYVLDLAIPVDTDTYLMHRDGDAGPYSPPPCCDLQTILDAAIGLSRHLLLAEFATRLRRAGRSAGDPTTVIQEFFPLVGG
jgi:hypothetical protein